MKLTKEQYKHPYVDHRLEALGYRQCTFCGLRHEGDSRLYRCKKCSKALCAGQATVNRLDGKICFTHEPSLHIPGRKHCGPVHVEPDKEVPFVGEEPEGKVEQVETSLPE